MMTGIHSKKSGVTSHMCVLESHWQPSIGWMGEEKDTKRNTDQLGDCCNSSVAVRVRDVIYAHLDKLDFFFKIEELCYSFFFFFEVANNYFLIPNHFPKLFCKFGCFCFFF